MREPAFAAQRPEGVVSTSPQILRRRRCRRHERQGEMVEVRRRPWFTVIMLSAVYACSQLDRQIMGILLEPIKRDLGASDAQMGFLVGLAFDVFYTFLAIPIAMLADKGHRKNIIAASIIPWSAMTAVCGMATTYLPMALARIGVAVGESGSSPASVSLIANLLDRKSVV